MLKSSRKNWWTRRCGGRDVVALALPLVISTASWTVMHFVDRMFLLWESTQAMAAAMPAGVFHYMLLCFPLGVATYVNTFVAQYHGADRPERIGVAVWQGMRLGLISIPLFLATIPAAPIVFRLAGHAPDIIRLEVLYYQVLTFGAGGAIFAAALSSFFTGRGETRVVMIVSVSSSLLNVVLDYAWIFGRWGFPAMGIEGAAWATVVSQWYRAIVYWRWMMRAKYREKYGLVAGRRYDPVLFRRLIRYGGPNGLRFVVEVAAFTFFILLVGRLGEEAMAATTLAFNINYLALVPMIGLSVAVSTLVGQQLGKDRPDLASRATWTSFWMAFVYMGTMAVLYVTVPDLFLWGHASGTTVEEFAPIRETAVVLLRFVAVYCLLDAASLVFAGAIRGAGDTRFILFTNLILFPVPVMVGWLGIRFFGMGILWCWGAVTAWICTLGIVFLVRFLRGRWRSMRVIERTGTTKGPSRT